MHIVYWPWVHVSVIRYSPCVPCHLPGSTGTGQSCTVKPVLRDHLSWKTHIPGKRSYISMYYNWICHHLSWETIFLWPIKWSYKRDSTVYRYLTSQTWLRETTCLERPIFCFIKYKTSLQWPAGLQLRPFHYIFSFYETEAMGHWCQGYWCKSELFYLTLSHAHTRRPPAYLLSGKRQCVLTKPHQNLAGQPCQTRKERC